MSTDQSSQWSQFLSLRRPFESLPATVIWQIVSRMHEKTFAAGERLIRRGDEGDCLMVIREGTVEVRVEDENGTIHKVDRLGVGGIVGEMALLTNEPRTADVWAIEPVEALFPGFDSFVTLDGWNMLAIPLWLPFGLTFVPATILFIRYRRRTTEGHCQKCGYDLTGNPSGVCPECGSKIEST